MGFNFLVTLSPSDLPITEEDVTFFSGQYIHHAAAPGNFLSHFAEMLVNPNLSKEPICLFLLKNHLSLSQPKDYVLGYNLNFTL